MTAPVAAHGMDYFVSVDGEDLTEYVKTSSFEKTPGIHDITGSGRTTQRNRGGQISHTFTMGGWYDETVGQGPSVLNAMVGTTVEIIRRVHGTGTGKPAQTFDAVVGKYVESQKNDDILQWTCDFTVDGDVTDSVQS